MTVSPPTCLSNETNVPHLKFSISFDSNSASNFDFRNDSNDLPKVATFFVCDATTRLGPNECRANERDGASGT